MSPAPLAFPPAGPRRPVPSFAPISVGRPRVRHRLHVAVRGRRRGLAAALAVTSAALASSAWGPAEPPDPPAPPERAAPDGTPSSPAAATIAARTARDARVSAPVRIADAGAVRLLRAGDRVDVLAHSPGTESARTVARGVRVQQVPEQLEFEGGATPDGALVVLRVPRSTAAALAGAGASGGLAVTLC